MHWAAIGNAIAPVAFIMIYLHYFLTDQYNDFRALFAECGTAKPTTLNLQLSADGFEVLLDYIYSGSLAITSENSDRVLHAANCLQVMMNDDGRVTGN